MKYNVNFLEKIFRYFVYYLLSNMILYIKNVNSTCILTKPVQLNLIIKKDRKYIILNTFGSIEYKNTHFFLYEMYIL